MKDYEYKGFTIRKITRVDFLVMRGAEACTKEDGRFPRTLKEAKALIDRLTA